MKGVEESKPASEVLEGSALNLQGKRVTVVGLGRSGVGAANLLSRLGACVTVTDRKGTRELADQVGMLIPGIRTALGSHPPELFENTDLIVVSPGVPSDAAPLKVAVDAGVRVIGELELAYQAVMGQGAGMAFLAVTGTNGKSTTTSLLYEIVRASGFSTLVGGNIGNALTGELFSTDLGKEVDYIVTEVSSFQLELSDAFRPKGAALL
ncbi:MAG TPA: Mur ligase family protein, partial [Dissulfurispiraceae bacterium]|nr:Mur ligase family protein [Dissulfurispiraceae bacterium]